VQLCVLYGSSEPMVVIGRPIASPRKDRRVVNLNQQVDSIDSNL
jgi:hypothetical protein